MKPQRERESGEKPVHGVRLEGSLHCWPQKIFHALPTTEGGERACLLQSAGASVENPLWTADGA